MGTEMLHISCWRSISTAVSSTQGASTNIRKTHKINWTCSAKVLYWCSITLNNPLHDFFEGLHQDVERQFRFLRLSQLARPSHPCPAWAHLAYLLLQSDSGHQKRGASQKNPLWLWPIMIQRADTWPSPAFSRRLSEYRRWSLLNMYVCARKEYPHENIASCRR